MKRETILKIVKASGVSAGELILVHFWGEDSEKEIANSFLAAVAELGATPVLLQQARSINRDIFASAKESCFDERYFELISKFDAVLDVFACQPIVLGYPLEDEQMDLYRRYIAQLFSKLMECKRFAQIRIPTEANAAESGLDPEDYITRMNEAYDVDYEALGAACRQEAEKYAGAEKAVVHTGEDCELNLTVFFEEFWLEDEKYSNVTLRVENGEVTGSSDEAVAKLFAGMPRENRIVCELGLGMNPNVKSLCGYTVLDEKMAGTFHIAVGANVMFGGANQATDHTDFVGKGKVEVK